MIYKTTLFCLYIIFYYICLLYLGLLLSKDNFGTRCLAFHPNDLFKDMNCETIYKDEDIEVETYEQRHKRRNTLRY